MATGHLRKRVGKNGVVSYQITVEGERDPITGERDRHYKTVNGTKKLAEATMRKMIADIEAGNVLSASAVKLETWMQEWLDLYLPNIEATTRAGYKEKIRNHILPKLGHIPLKSLKTAHVQNWVNELREKDNLSPKTIRNTYLNLKAALDKAVVLKMIPNNPCTGVVLPKGTKYTAQIYNQEEINAMLEAAKGTDMYLPLLLEVSVGFRRGELLALQWSHIDFEASVIHIRENRVIADGKVETKAPKSSAGIRDITIGPNVLAALKKAHTQYQLNKLSFGAGFVDSDLVICQKNGKPYRPESMTQKWERFVKRNNLKPIRFHDLRHSCTTALLEAGVDPKTVQQRLGHADIGITMNIYAHCTQSMDQKAADTMDQLLFPNAV